MRNHLVKLRYIVSLFVVVIAFPFFFLGGTTEASSNLMYAIWDCGHLIFFIAVVILLSKKYDVNNWRVGLTISVAVFLGGGLIEIIQAKIGRDGNWDDLLRDLTGTWLGLFWLQSPRKWIWLGRMVSVLLLIPNVLTVFYESWLQLHARQEFPLLAGFESFIEFQGRREIIERSSQYHTQGLYSAKLQLTTANYTGINFNRLYGDWQPYKQLSIDIYNPDTQPLNMTIRINDIHHKDHGWKHTDRFNKIFSLYQGWNHLTFSLDDIQHAPANREMDLSKISAVEIFVSKLPAARIIYIDNFRLD